MELARFDLVGSSVGNLNISHPDVTYNFAPIITYQFKHLVTLNIPHALLNEIGNGLRIQVPTINSSAEGSFVFFDSASSLNPMKLGAASGEVFANIRIRASRNLYKAPLPSQNITLDLGLESIDILAGENLYDLSPISQYLFGYSPDVLEPSIAQTGGTTTLIIGTDGSLENFASGVVVSTFRLPKPVNFWTEYNLASEFVNYKNDNV